MIQLHDALAASSVRRTSNGHLVADVRVARTGIQEYLGVEVGRPDLPVVRVYRPPEAVFDQMAMHSYAYRPMTNDHQGTITADNWREHAIGMTGGEVVRDGAFVRVPVMLMDSAAIKAWEGGKRELSMGYSLDLEFADGVTPDGEAYNAVASNLRMNHLALVTQARGGSDLKIGDGGAPQDQAPRNPDGGPTMAETRQVVHDGLTIETTPQGAQVIEKLTAKVADMRTAADGARTAHEAALADASAKLSKAEAERDAAKAQVLDAAAIDKLVAERAAFLADAKALHDADYTGKTPAEVRRAIVVAKLGDKAIAGKDDAYVAARFDILAEDAKKDPVRNALLADGNRGVPTNDNGQSAREAALRDAWRTAGVAKA